MKEGEKSASILILNPSILPYLGNWSGLSWVPSLDTCSFVDKIGK